MTRLPVPEGVSAGVGLGELGGTRRFFDRVAAMLPDVLAEGNSKLISHRFGAAELVSAESWPRIIWVPGRDRFDVEKAASFMNPGNSRAAKPYTVRWAGADVYFHGQDAQMVEDMLNEYLSALYGAIGTPSLSIEGGEWVSQTEAEWLKDGESYRLSLAVAIPVVKVEHYTKLLAVVTQCGCEDC